MLHPDPQLCWFVTAAFLMERRDTFLSLTGINIQSEVQRQLVQGFLDSEDIKWTFQLALDLEGSTPKSFRSSATLLAPPPSHQDDHPPDHGCTGDHWFCMPVQPEELVPQLLQSSHNLALEYGRMPFQFFAIDLRAKGQSLLSSCIYDCPFHHAPHHPSLGLTWGLLYLNVVYHTKVPVRVVIVFPFVPTFFLCVCVC